MEAWTYDAIAIAERIRRQRTSLNITQAELAEKIGRSTKFCADIERGSCGMSIDTFMLFCQVLQLSPSVLLLGDPTVFSDDQDTTAQILECLAACTQEQKSAVLEIVRQFARKP